MRRIANDGQVAQGLGWTSIAIGLTEMLAPKMVERMLGIGNGQHAGTLRVLGVREIMHGVDLLTHHDPTPGIWARVAGDMLDGVLLGAAATKSKSPGGFAAVATSVLGIVALDVLEATRLGAPRHAH
jgi:hypothetical protein